jgi:branched-chain amino acid transport system substrate-binding protein
MLWERWVTDSIFTWSNSRGYPRNKPVYPFEIHEGAKIKVLEIIPG